MLAGTPLPEVLAVLLAYAIGGLPFGWLMARVFKGVDLRRVGSGNIGATNASRVWDGMNCVWIFTAVFILDFAKGFAAANWSNALGAWLGAATGGETLVVACGGAAILGHVFTPYLGFRGGKGVATTLGVVTALAWESSLWALGAWGLLVGVTRYMSLGSIGAMLALPLSYVLKWGEDTWTRHLAVFALLTAVALMVVWKHRANVARILQGRERKVGALDQQL